MQTYESIWSVPRHRHKFYLATFFITALALYAYVLTAPQTCDWVSDSLWELHDMSATGYCISTSNIGKDVIEYAPSVIMLAAFIAMLLTWTLNILEHFMDRAIRFKHRRE